MDKVFHRQGLINTWEEERGREREGEREGGRKGQGYSYVVIHQTRGSGSYERWVVG